MLGIIISFLALTLSIIVFWFSYLRDIKIDIEAEDQIQITEEQGMLAFNILFLINASGSENKFSYTKFNSADVIFPDGLTELFKPMAHLSEFGVGQKNETRNIPISLKGGDRIVKTIAFQNNPKMSKHIHWIEGCYNLKIRIMLNRKGETTILVPFSIDSENIKIIQIPKAILMLPVREM